MSKFRFMGPRKHKIYRLVDTRYTPEDKDYVRYVGRTCKIPSTRFCQHLTDIEDKSPKSNWLREAKSNSQGSNCIDFEILDVVDTRREAKKREHYWITYHEQLGYNLTNQTLLERPVDLRDWSNPLEGRKRLAKKSNQDKERHRYMG